MSKVLGKTKVLGQTSFTEAAVQQLSQANADGAQIYSSHLRNSNTHQPRYCTAGVRTDAVMQQLRQASKNVANGDNKCLCYIVTADFLYVLLW